MSRKPASNGTIFENALARTFEAYRYFKICDVEKVEPPVKTFGHGPAKRTVFLENPFLDFIGAWTEYGGRLLVVECKSTLTELLPIGATGRDAMGRKVSTTGIKLAQLEAGQRWERAGAVVCYLWNIAGAVRMVTPSMVAAQLTKRKSLRWCDAHPVPQGKGFILIDFLALMRRIHKPTT